MISFISVLARILEGQGAKLKKGNVSWGSKSINFLFNVLICGSFASFWFLQKQRLLSSIKETTIQSKETFDIINLK